MPIGKKFAPEEKKVFLETCEQIKPVSACEWNMVTEMHNKHFPGNFHNKETLKKLFNNLQDSQKTFNYFMYAWDINKLMKNKS
jgi:Ran GTPase-activating protein (RanGAP) involved in mRNA processing and transport